MATQEELLARQNELLEQQIELLREQKDATDRKTRAEEASKREASDQARRKSRPDVAPEELTRKVQRLEAAARGVKVRDLTFGDFTFLNWESIGEEHDICDESNAPFPDEAARVQFVREWFCEPEGSKTPRLRRSMIFNRRTGVLALTVLMFMSVAVGAVILAGYSLLPRGVADKISFQGCIALMIVGFFSALIHTRIEVSSFKLQLKNQLTRAQKALYPWQSVRWLALAYASITDYCPLVIQKLYPLDTSADNEAPNGLDFFRKRIAEAAGYVLSGFGASRKRGGGDSFVGEGRFDGAIQEVMDSVNDIQTRFMIWADTAYWITACFTSAAVIWTLTVLARWYGPPSI